MTFEHQDEVNRLVECTQPLLIGVRHHSAAMARVIGELLDQFQPESVLIELPPEFSPWLEWLASDDLQAPVALAGTTAGLASLSFYPFADFSPELAAIRWAKKNEVPVRPIDLPIASRSGLHGDAEKQTEPIGLLQALLKRTQANDTGSLWEKLVETPAADSDAEAIRRAGLLFGWALRKNDQRASLYDRSREAFMRECIAEADGKVAAVVGSYHAAALLPEPMLWEPPETLLKEEPPAEVTTALIPYSFAQLDERSGYPAGVRDPWWHQKVFEASSVEDMDALVADVTVGVCRELRADGHAAGAADGKEVLRMARDLARLRGYAAAGRGEFMEASQMCLTQGQLLGRGHAVANAMARVLIGSQNGVLPEGVPRSGLGPDVEDTLRTLNLPGPESLGQDSKRLRLDPLRSNLDRARVVVMGRLAACEIPYAKAAAGQSGLRESLTEVRDVKWEHATSAMLELSAARGATLEQATFGLLSATGSSDKEPTAAEVLQQVRAAADCGLGQLVGRGLNQIMGRFSLDASLAELTSAMELIGRIERGHIAGLPLVDEDQRLPFVRRFEVPKSVQTTPLLQAAIARVEGLFGADDVHDVYALLELVLWFQQQESMSSEAEASDGGRYVLEAGRLIWLLQRMAKTGSSLMQGASHAALMLLDQRSLEEFAATLGSWLDGATTAELRGDLMKRLAGALVMALPRVAADVSCLDDFEERAASLSDREFLRRVPAVRGAFEKIAPQTRRRILDALLDRLPDDQAERVSDIADADLATRRFDADEAARLALAELMPGLELTADLEAADAETESRSLRVAGQQISMGDRWRLMIGVGDENEEDNMCSRAARALDELYGRCGGGRSRSRRSGGSGSGGGAGRGTRFPTTREWSEELESLFGSDVREEVLGTAAENGRAGALAALDEQQVTPSIELLEQVLSMRGALPETHTEHLRRLAKRIVDELVKQLAVQLRPALNGFSVARPTQRRTPRLDLKRTLRANLKTVHRNDDGDWQIIPERLYFRSLAKRSMDWHLIFVVDVSGSMEPSVIYSAMMSAIFNSLPALSVRFLAFSTEVMDFSEHVDDPLSMLLEVEIGGGTHIAKGLNAARQQMRVPSRTIVVLLTDFDEGFPISRLLAEVRALSETGARLLGLAALDDSGAARFNKGVAQQVASCGMPVAALSPQELARWVGEQIS